MISQHGKRGLKLIPRSSYSFLRKFLSILREPYREEILWDIRWGFRQTYKENKKSLKSRLRQRHNTDYWFQYEIFCAVVYSLMKKPINFVMFLMRIIAS
jgi:hypothetical protein